MIHPYKHPRPRPAMAWLLDHRSVLVEDGRVLPLAAADGLQVWAGFDLVNSLLADGHGEAVCWDAKPIRWSPDINVGTYSVRVLQVPYPEDPDVAVGGLSEWRDWLCHYGAAPGGSLGGSGLSLLKATLEDVLWTAVGAVPPVRYVLGGRQETGPGGDDLPGCEYVGDIVHTDMRAAYARTLGELRYGGSWHHFPGSSYPLRRWGDHHGRLIFVRAKVEIPEMRYGPLPVRPRKERPTFLQLVDPVEYPAGRTLQGCWTWEEVTEAEASGCKVKSILDTWVNATAQQPFLPWWRAVQAGRLIHGFGGFLAKATGNATWGMFAVRSGGRRQVIRVVSEGGRRRKEIARSLPVSGNPSMRAPDLAEQITGRVRAALHGAIREAGDDLICAHTDGIWSFDSVVVPGWRRKYDQGTRLRLLNPQLLAYTDSSGSECYMTAGVPAWRSAEYFEQRWAEMLDERAGRPWAMGGPVGGTPLPVVRRVTRRSRLRVVS